MLGLTLGLLQPHGPPARVCYFRDMMSVHIPVALPVPLR